MDKNVEAHKISPFLAYAAYFLVTKCVFPTKEYNKRVLTEKSYIFAPGHTNNFDGYVLWSLLAKNYNIDSFMYKEFWTNFPKVAKMLPLCNVYPITREKLVLSELKDELEKLKNDDHSLIIFPQGRHVDPKVINELFDYSLKTVPLGAFFISAHSNKPLVPIFIEPSQKFKSNAVIYGNPIYPEEFGLSSKSKILNKDKLMMFKKAWLEEINKLYEEFNDIVKRDSHPYLIHKMYTDATGLNFRAPTDPNRVIEYIDYINILKSEYEKTKCEDIDELGKNANINSEIIEEIKSIKNNYELNLRKN